jgi:hypothetical protein
MQVPGKGEETFTEPKRKFSRSFGQTRLSITVPHVFLALVVFVVIRVRALLVLWRRVMWHHCALRVCRGLVHLGAVLTVRYAT